MQTLKAFGLLPWGMVSLRLSKVGLGLAMGEVVVKEQKVPMGVISEQPKKMDF